MNINMALDSTEEPFSSLKLMQRKRDEEEASNDITMQEQCESALRSVEEHKAHLKMTVDRMQQCKEDFKEFLKIKDADQRLAVKRAKHDRDVIAQREETLHELEEEIKAFTEEKDKLEKRVRKYAVYSHYMDKVVQAGKLEAQRMITRFQTLMAARDHLQITTQQGQEKIQHARTDLQDLTKESSDVIMKLNSIAAQYQRRLDEAQQNCMHWENTWLHIQKTAAEQTIMCGKIRMACLNLYRDVCGKSLYCQQFPVDPEDTHGQLDMIESFITQWISSLRM